MPLLQETEKSDFAKSIQKDWFAVRRFVATKFGKKPDINAILFLIGINEAQLPKSEFSKEEKEKLLNLAFLTLLAQNGYYKREGLGEDGLPHFKPTKSLPDLNKQEQESWLKKMIVYYFKSKKYID